MKMRKDDQTDNIFSDLLFTVLTAIVMILFWAMLLINPIADEGNIRKNAMYVAEMSWPTGLDCDIDLWVQGPDGQHVAFPVKSVSYMHIERDDLGFTGDEYKDMDGKELLVPENREIWTLRGKVDGEYVMNIHAYNCRRANTMGGVMLEIGEPINVPVTLQIIQINPTYNRMPPIRFTLTKLWQEETIAIFELINDTQDIVFRTPVRTPLVTSQRQGQTGGLDK